MKQILSKVRPAQIPESLRDKILESCQHAFLEPSEKIAQSNWLDSCLRIAAATAVLLFALTCYSSFVSDPSVFAATRLSRLEAKNVGAAGLTGNSSLILMRRKTSW